MSTHSATQTSEEESLPTGRTQLEAKPRAVLDAARSVLPFPATASEPADFIEGLDELSSPEDLGELSWPDEDLGEEDLFDPLELSDEVPRPEAVAQKKRDLAFWFVVMPVGMVALFLAALFLARTPLIAGPIIQDIMAKEASQRGVELYIESMRPVGLFGVRFEQVRGRLRRGPYVLDTRMEALDVSPDIWGSIKQGRPIPGELRLEKARIVLERKPDLATGGRAGAKVDASEKTAADALGLNEIRIVGVDVEVELRAGRAFQSTHPIELDRLEATLPLEGTPLPTTMSAHGRLPDGVPFALSTRPVQGEQGNEIVLQHQEPTRIHEWFGGQLPFQMTSQGVVLCSGCAQDTIDFGAVELKLPNLGNGMNVTAPQARVVWSEGKGELQLEGVGIRGLSDPGVGVDLTRTHFVVDSATGKHSGELELKERGTGGTIELQWAWENPLETLKGSVQARRFSLKPLLVLLDATPVLHAGQITGTMNATLDIGTRHIELATDLEFVDAEASLPMLTKEPLGIPMLGLRSDLLLDLDARALSIAKLEVDLGTVRPLKIRGEIIEARQGWRFAIEALGRDIDAEALRKALPPVIRAPVEGAELAGYFGYDFHASGHSAYPESLRLEINIDGDVEVLQDGPQADIMALAGTGAPWAGEGSGLTIPVEPDAWVSYEMLPPHIPRGVIAAEDAQFFKHNGFDFGGLARAMMHNLSVGRMERGGSTITQQLIKNLFLSRDRTATRKLQEAYLTWRIEHQLGKQRILEIYMNIVQWGDSLHGLRAASRHYFQRAPEELSVDQIAVLSSILPNPVRFGGHIDKGRFASSRLTKFEHIMANLRFMGDITYQDYVHLMAQAKQGKIGGLTLEICADDDTAPEGAKDCARESSEL